MPAWNPREISGRASECGMAAYVLRILLAALLGILRSPPSALVLPTNHL